MIAKRPKPTSPAYFWLNSASFWYPEFVEASSWLDHAPFAFWLTSAVKPRTFVELGTKHGYSYFAFCQAVKTLDLRTCCYAVDNWKGDEHAGFYGEEIFQRVRLYNDAEYGEFSHLVRSTFDEALELFPDASIDLLHIDGRHFYEDAKYDFDSYRPKLSDRAVVLFHDTAVRERGFGVYQLWAELTHQYPSFEFLHGHGLGVLGYGRNLPDEIASFLAITREDTTALAVRSAYCRLGAAIKSDFFGARNLSKLDAQAENLSAKLKVENAKTEDLEAKRAGTAAEAAKLKAKTEDLEAKLKAQQARAHILKLKLAERRRYMQKLQKSISWRITKPLRALRQKLTWFQPRLLKRVRRFQPARRLEKSASSALSAHALDTLLRIRLRCVGVTVVIPVYNALDELSACLQSVLCHTPRDIRFVIIDDASPDPRVQEVLSKYRTTPGLELHRNEINLGFTRTVNRGIELAGRDDVVLLNSDTEVTPRWLPNLQLACYSSDRIGTATALSNNAGAFSVPKTGEANEIPTWLTLDEYGRALNLNSKRSYPETPTGNGFCLYLRRSCIDDIGAFNADAFPRGYGEENDFCLRAGRKGWRHVVDDATLIRHRRSASFGEEKRHLMREGRRIIDGRYPYYTKAVHAFVGGSGLKSVTRRVQHLIDSNRKQTSAAKPRVLYVLSTRTGGTPQSNQDLMTALEGRVDALVLRCNGQTLELSRFQGGTYTKVRRSRLPERLKAFPHRSDDYDRVVADWLVHYGVELVHIRHIAWHSLGLIELAKTLRLPLVFSFHDFYTVCPSVNLLDEADRNCGGKCTSTIGECRQPLWQDPDFPPLKHAAIHEWQRMFSASLQMCDSFVTTSQSAAATFKANYPFLEERRFSVIPHGRDFPDMELCASLEPGKPLRLLLPGNLSRPKGLGIVTELCSLAADHQIELHLLGSTSEGLAGPNVINHGPYEREDFARKVKEINPHLGGVLSICHETYCHTLTELWSCGVPVIGFDFGAVGERIRESGGGWLAADATAKAVLEVIDQLRSQPQLQETARARVVHWQTGEGRRRDGHAMGHDYYDLYRALLSNRATAEEHARPRVAVIAPGTRAVNYQLVRAPGSTHVRLGEKTHDSPDRPVRYDWVNVDVDLDWLTSVFDAVIVQRTALDDRAVDELLAYCRERCALIIELDDYLLGTDASWPSYNPYHHRRQALTKLLRAATLVVVSTEELKGRLTHLNDRIVVSPNALSERLWFTPLPEHIDKLAVSPTRERADEKRAIYMGSATHDDDLKMLAEAVAELRATYPHFRLFTVGITKSPEPWHEALTIANRNYPQFVQWFRRVARLMDFAVAPLIDTDFNRAKSTIKLLEYSAAGLPTIASDVTPYREAIENGITGLLAANNPSAWAAAMRYACDNLDKMQAMAERQRQEVIRHHLIGQQVPKFDAAVLSAIEEFRRTTQAGRREGSQYAAPLASASLSEPN